ncbi:MAG: tRNA dihydrouridine synthase DusB [Acidobacteria bacterium]|nr:tRNA dihydrouridine synthase DusB [Acidobacteriota bacterium]
MTKGHEIRIGKLNIQPNVFLAPLAGITDRYFRAVIRSLGGCGITYSELVSAEGMIRNQPNTLAMMPPGLDERPYAIQIYGSRPQSMAAAGRLAQDAGADMVDINVGCPARKVVRNLGGSYLLKDLPLLERIITAVRQEVDVPLTIKIRSGFNESSINYLDVGRMAVDCGVDGITLHPRTRAQGFTGQADWSHIRRLKDALPIPVIGNGDIVQPADALAMFEVTGCDAVMIGRGIMRNPWLIRQIHDLRTTGDYTPTQVSDALRLCLDMACTTYREHPEKKILGEMKKFCSWLVYDFPGAARHRQILYTCKEPLELIDHLRWLTETLAAESAEISC